MLNVATKLLEKFPEIDFSCKIMYDSGVKYVTKCISTVDKKLVQEWIEE